MFRRNGLLVFGLAVVLLLSLLTYKAFVPMAVVPSLSASMAAVEHTHFTALQVNSELQSNTIASTDAVTVGATLSVAGASTLTGTVTTIGQLTVGTIAKVGTFLQYTSGATQTVVNTQPITPTATYQTIAAAVNVYTDNLIRAGALTGQLWIVQNIGTPTITITDANTCNLASTYAMGISDTLTLIFDGTSWNEIARSDN